MGTTGWSAPLAPRFRVCVLAIIAGTTACASALAESLPTDVVIQFLTNAHTGQAMRAEDWLSKEMRDAKKFRAFGGLDSLVKQSTSFAQAYKGLKSIIVHDVKRNGNFYEVGAEIRFFDDDKRRESPAFAEREDMLWRFRVHKEAGGWRLSF